MTCPNCGDSEFTLTATYKHAWITCNECGVVQRERRQRYPFDRAWARFLIENTRLRSLFARTLLRQQEIIEDEQRFYNYYHDTASRGVQGTKWESVNASVFANLKKLGIAITGKSVLDVSGGPGFLTQQLQKFAKRAVVTEFSQHAIDGMTKALSIEGVRFDYNSDYLDRCVDGPFDVIFVIYSIGFCNNLREFVRALGKLTQTGSVVYVCHSPPTLGLMLRWQFDEYTYTRCWPADIAAKYFAEIGMEEIARLDEGRFRYDEDWYDNATRLPARILLRFHRLVGRYYWWRATGRNVNVNRELIQKKCAASLSTLSVLAADPV